MSNVTEEIFCESHYAVHVFSDCLGIKIIDGMFGIVENDEIELIVAVVAVHEHLLELLLTGQALRELTIILIKELDYLLQTCSEIVSTLIGILSWLRLFLHRWSAFSI